LEKGGGGIWGKGGKLTRDGLSGSKGNVWGRSPVRIQARQGTPIDAKETKKPVGGGGGEKKGKKAGDPYTGCWKERVERREGGRAWTGRSVKKKRKNWHMEERRLCKNEET